MKQSRNGSTEMDAGKFYALLRFEEAALALRATLKLGIVDRVEDRKLSQAEFAELFGFTPQGARTFAALLCVMDVLERKSADGVDHFYVSATARATLADGIATSRRTYLQMGSGHEVDEFIGMLKGDFPKEALPLYGSEEVAETLMDLPDVAREISIGLSSRARNFAGPLADAIASQSSTGKTLADIGAGSPYVAQACLRKMSYLEKAILVDRPNGMEFVRELAEECDFGKKKIEFHEQDFFQAVPSADIYCVSNTAHDWLKGEYLKIMTNIRSTISSNGIVCVHEPVLLIDWKSSAEWIRALWMACYAMTLYKLCNGKGTCYSQVEHESIMAKAGFSMVDEPMETVDGCTALFFKCSSST